MKNYNLSFSVSISTNESYASTKILNINIDETLPANTDPQKYIRARLAEEVKRKFDQLVTPIENFTDEEKKPDPLSDDIPF